MMPEGYPFAAPAPRQPPKAKQSLAEKLKEQSWMLHYGMNAKRATCLFCGVNTLSYLDKAQWQCAHVVAEKWFSTSKVLEPYYLVPSCAACNLSMATTNALDYLWQTFRVTSLKVVCTNIFKAFAERNAEHMEEAFGGCMWRLIAHLFGSDEHTAGGGISCANEPEIYALLQLHQMELLQVEIAEHLKQVSDKSARMEALVKTRFKPSKRARLFA